MKKEDDIMENQKQYPMTQEGYEQLEKLEELKTVKRPEVVEKLKLARSFGDLSENSEYDVLLKMNKDSLNKTFNVSNICLDMH